MVLAFRFSTQIGACPAADADRVATHLAAAGLPTRLADVGHRGRATRLLDWIARDKKNESGALTLVLANGIGRAYLDRAVDPQRLSAFLNEAP
jgi:3-dehydroquinate synthetase